MAALLRVAGLFSPARYSSLPERPLPGDPERYPTGDELGAYLRDYADWLEPTSAPASA